MSSGQDLGFNSNQAGLLKVANPSERKYPRRLTPKRKELAREFITKTFHKYSLAQVWTPEWQNDFLHHIDPKAKCDLVRSDVAKWVIKYFDFFKQVFEQVAQAGTPQGIGSQAAGYGTGTTDSSMALVPYENHNEGASVAAQKLCLPPPEQQGQEGVQQEVATDSSMALVPYVNHNEGASAAAPKLCLPAPEPQGQEGVQQEVDYEDLVVLGNSLEESLFIAASNANFLLPSANSLPLIIEMYNAHLENCKIAGVYPPEIANSYSTLGALLRLQTISNGPLFQSEVPSSTSYSEMETDASSQDEA